jgi:hypothetical protein
LGDYIIIYRINQELKSPKYALQKFKNKIKRERQKSSQTIAIDVFLAAYFPMTLSV